MARGRYYGRGPVHMRWNHRYGQFSKAYYEEEYYGFNILLADPSGVATYAELGFASLLWSYMTPIFPKPSAHDVIAGFFEPNAYDE